jgi:micrococcal nuclease
MLKKSVTFFYSIVITLCVFSPSFSNETFYLVKWVDDGDTIVLSDGRRVRYIGINAPEVEHFSSGKQVRTGEPFGRQAKDYNKELVYLKKVRLEFDHEKHDRYGRTLAYVFLEDNTFVNDKIVLEGFAYCLPVKPNMRHSSGLLRSQRKAMAQRINIWKGIDKTKAGFFGNRRSMRFHLRDCRFGKKTAPKNRIVFDSIYDAFYMGFAPCRSCNPLDSAKSLQLFSR